MITLENLYFTSFENLNNLKITIKKRQQKLYSEISTFNQKRPSIEKNEVN